MLRLRALSSVISIGETVLYRDWGSNCVVSKNHMNISHSHRCLRSLQPLHALDLPFLVASHAKERQRSMTKRTAGSERLNEQTNHSLDSSYFLNTVYGKTVVCFAWVITDSSDLFNGLRCEWFVFLHGDTEDMFVWRAACRVTENNGSNILPSDQEDWKWGTWPHGNRTAFYELMSVIVVYGKFLHADNT